MVFPGLYKPVSWGCSKLKVNMQNTCIGNSIISVKNSKGVVSVRVSHNKNTSAQEETCKSHEKNEIRILYFSCKYQCNISNKHLKQVSQTDKYKSSSQKETYHLRRNNTKIKWPTIIRSVNCQQAIRNLTTYYFYLTSQQLINGNNKLRQILQSHQQCNEKKYKGISETINYTFIT